MRKVTKREKVVLGIGTLATIVILFYFLLLPVISGGSGGTSDLKTKQEKLESVKRLKAMEPMLTRLETRMRSRLGYRDLSFKRGIADSVIIKYLAQTAGESNIRENLEQLDAKPYRSRKSEELRKADQTVLKSIVNELYLCQLTDELENLDNVPKDNSPSDSDPPQEEKQDNTEETKAIDEKIEKLDQESKPEEAKEDKKEESAESEKKQSETPTPDAVVFPLIPKDIPDEIKRSLVTTIEAKPERNITAEDIDKIIAEAKIEDKDEFDRVKKRLSLYNDRVKEKKTELVKWLINLGVLQGVKLEERAGVFSIKMVFKGDIGQLVNFLYKLQDSANWIKVEGIQITIADRNQTLLGVELSMVATALYEE